MAPGSGGGSIGWGAALVIASLALSAFNVYVALASASEWSPEPTSSLIGSIGYMGPALSSSCTSTRNPILEPTCLTDLPGGYCYHFTCGMVSPTIP